MASRREKTCHKSLLPSHAPGTACPSAWHDYGRERGSDCGMLEREAAGEEQRGMWQGQRGGNEEWGEAQLAAASNWAEQVSMADQTHMQRGAKERGREGHKQSSRAGQAAGVEEGRKGGRREAGHTPAVTASL